MQVNKRIVLIFSITLVFVTGCSLLGGSGVTTPQPAPFTNPATTSIPVVVTNPILTQPAQIPTQTTAPATTIPPTPTETQPAFDIGRMLTIEYLRKLPIQGSQITIEQKLADRSNYHQYLASYLSEGNQIYGLLTIPFGDPPPGGFKAIVFNHGYIPPSIYKTTERYVAYVDTLARNGFVVFKIDYRGNGESEGEAAGTYFSPGYTIDSIAALKSLQTMDNIDPQGIGMWGHSMAGNLVLRAMLIDPDIKAGVIWAGAVYSYDDFAKYGISDSSYRPPPTPSNQDTPQPPRGSRLIIDTYGQPDTKIDYWKAVSLTDNIQYLNSPLQIHHAKDDIVVNIGYSYDLVAVLQANNKPYEFYTYDGGGHNIYSPYFEQAMQRTVEFFKNHL
jgi:dipeptidyl aminopeptidase/acylaminoacyl peptidase